MRGDGWVLRYSHCAIFEALAVVMLTTSTAILRRQPVQSNRCGYVDCHSPAMLIAAAEVTLGSCTALISRQAI